jgi:uncharacterized protein (DUF1778 family)
MAGRPKKLQTQAKTYTLRIRMTPAQRALLEEAAQSRGLETSTWARSELIGLANELLHNKPTPRAAKEEKKRS